MSSIIYNINMIIKNLKDYNEAILFWNEEPSKLEGVDLAYYIHDYKRRGKYNIKFYTSVFNLKDESFEEILNRSSSSTRRYYRKALREGFNISEMELTDNNVEIVVKSYNDFAKEKSLTPITTKAILENREFIRVYKTILNQSNSYHVVWCDGKIVRSWLSCTDKDFYLNRQAGMYTVAQQLELVRLFQEDNYEVYDLGGLFQEGQDIESVKGIVNFKRSFGGEEIQIWKNVDILTPKGEEAYNKYFKNRK